MNNGKFLKRTEFLLVMIIGFLAELFGAIMVTTPPVFYILFALSVIFTFFFVFANNKIYKYHGFYAVTVSIMLLGLLCLYGNRFQTVHIIIFTYICFAALFKQISVSIYSMVLVTILEIIIYVFYRRNLFESGFPYFIGYILPIYFAQFYLIFLLKSLRKREKIYEQKNESNEELLKVIHMKKAETEEANRAKTTFLANMSHEIRTPINSILGFNELILREANEENNSKQIIKYSENALQSGKTLLSIINDILDFSKIESGKSELIPEKYELCALLEELVLMIRQRAENKNITFTTDVSDDIPHILYGDKKRIKQIILNILTNAVKYTSAGSVTFKVYATPHIYNENILNVTEYDLSDASVKNEDKTIIDLHIVVKDTGIGIKLEDLSKLFDEFERFDVKRNKSIEGTGLGLVITKFWTDRMGGKIDVQSKYEIGSTFSVVIPQIVLSDETIGAYKEEYSKTINESVPYKESFTAPEAKVLVVDDNEMNLLVFSGLLKKTKIHVDTALSGRECLTMIKLNRYDLIFMDHMMPTMDGIETLRKIRSSSNHLCENTPVISLTANAISGMRTFYLREGFTDYISKPINPETLEEILIKYLPHYLIHEADHSATVETNNTATNNAATDNAATNNADNTEKSDNINNTDNKFSNLEKIGIDLKQGMLYAGGDDENYIFNLQFFTSTAKKAIDRLEEFRANADCANYATQAHALKGNLRTIGASNASNLAFEHEKSGKASDMESINKTFDELKNQVMNICETIEKMELNQD